MNLKFWKKKTANENDAKDAPAVSGVLARIKARVALLVGRFRSPPPFKAEVAAGAEVSSVQPASVGTEGASLPADASAQRGKLARIGIALITTIRARMLIVGVVLLLLMLLAFGYAAWTIFLSSPDPENDVTELIEDKHANDPPLPIIQPVSVPEAVSAVAAASAPVEIDAVSVAEAHAVSSVKAAQPLAVPASHVPQTELETLRQKNAELQMQLDALKKVQQPSSASVKLYPGDGRGAAGGVATVGNSDPKAAATTLKEAIESMNTGVNYQKKPAK